MPRPILSEVPEFYHGYIGLVTQDDVKKALEDNTKEIFSFLETIPADKWSYRYQPGKWSIKEMLQHIVDAERIFCYRALCFARKDATPLPGFGENSYAAQSKADDRNPQDILQEFEAVRKASQFLFSSFDEEQLQTKGVANGNSISVNAIGFILSGHARHHIKILKERYL